MPGIPLPVKIKKSRKCTRCTKRYKPSEACCPHCKDIRDGVELEEFIEEFKQRKQANAELGMVFLGVTSVLGIFLLALILL